MLKWIESTGKTEEAAIEAALAKLGMDRDDVSVEILERAKSGFLGIGSCPARIKVTYEAPDEPAPEPSTPAAPVEEISTAPVQAVEKTPEQPTPAMEQADLGEDEVAARIEEFLTAGLLAHMGAERPLPGSPWTSGATTRWNWWVRTWAA